MLGWEKGKESVAEREGTVARVFERLRPKHFCFKRWSRHSGSNDGHEGVRRHLQSIVVLLKQDVLVVLEGGNADIMLRPQVDHASHA